jgi:hypothetical protein
MTRTLPCGTTALISPVKSDYRNEHSRPPLKYYRQYHANIRSFASITVRDYVLAAADVFAVCITGQPLNVQNLVVNSICS